MEFKISRFRYTWKGNWNTDTVYNRDDIVRVGGNTYYCVSQHTAASNFYVDLPTRWEVMTESVSWRAGWQSSTSYRINDLVNYGGLIYKCNTAHTSLPSFSGDADKWDIYAVSSRFRGDWNTSTVYAVGDLVQYNAFVYRCIIEHSSEAFTYGLEDDIAHWEVYYNNIKYRGDFTPAEKYVVDDLVKFQGTIWRCQQSYTSGDDSTLNFNEDFWSVEIPGQQYHGDWMIDHAYGRGSIVRYGGFLYIAIQSNESLIPPNETNDWALLGRGFNFSGDWSETSSYKVGDTVRRGGQVYRALADTQGIVQTPTVYTVTIVPPLSADVGNKYSIDGEYRPQLEFEVGNTYLFNQTDLLNLYFPNTNVTGALNTHPLLFSSDNPNGALDGGTIFSNGVTWQLDGRTVTPSEYVAGFANAYVRTVSITIDRNTPSTLYYYCYNHLNMGNSISVNSSLLGLDPSVSANWELLIPGYRFRRGYLDRVDYAAGDIVAYGNSLYYALVGHLSNADETYPGNGNGFNYWATYLENDTQSALQNVGDLITYGSKIDGSTLGEINIPVGVAGEVLTVNEQSIFQYQQLGEKVNFLYVDLNGVDAIGRGTTPDTAFRTVRYACETAAKLVGHTTVKIGAGVFEEVLPIVVPAKCAVVGSELRTTTIKAAPAYPELVADSTYTIAALTYLRDLIAPINDQNGSAPALGNNKTQILYLQDGSLQSTADLEARIDDIIAYINFYVNSTGTIDPISGSNEPTTDDGAWKAAGIFIANKEYISYDVQQFILNTYPDYPFDPARCRRDVERYIDAIVHDIIYPGNYMSYMAGRYYRNAVLGSTGEDMFYMGDASGLRNCTLDGLTGVLSPPNVFDLFRRPLGGAYVSLNPGWGPNDESVWITTRSPYVQGVTTLGTACFGQKIDGALHNGGNKSITSNDFTQVLSDGVGAWVLNNGRAELVSVFTYYCHVGYLATSGGIIRGTNGNCSYGLYGALAQDTDTTETPKTATVNTRLQQAVVEAVVADSLVGILALEYSNAGENYTTATYTVTGSGTGANFIADEFRDGAVFQADVTVAEDSTSPGGGGYLITGNFAQGGNDTTIQIAANDANSFATYNGMRIIIIAGTGTGQYAYISGYDTLTKIVNVTKESTNVSGWDHVIPGYPIESTLDGTTSYRIEPRPIWSAPTYSSSNVVLPTTTTWKAITFGNTIENYSVTAPEGSATPLVGTKLGATFSITKDAENYTVTLASAGAGYEIGDDLTIPGTSVGGSSPANDIIVTVTAVGNSVYGIVSFTTSGYGRKGRYVAIAEGGNLAAFSVDGSTWTSSTLPSNGDWIAVTQGNRFVAIRNDSNAGAVSSDGITWTGFTIAGPSASWVDIAYGNGRFVAIASDDNRFAYSSNGTSWTAGTLPTVGDSATSNWTAIAYGKGKFIAIAQDNAAAAVSEDGISWTSTVLPDLVDYVDIEYGNNRFIAISSSQNAIAYTFDGTTWYSGTLPSQDGSSIMNWKNITYGQGVFLALCDTGNAVIGGDATTGPTTFAASSEDGIVWTPRNLSESLSWRDAAFGNNNGDTAWVAIADESTTQATRIKLGSRTRGRITASAGVLGTIRIWEPGSGYEESPELTIIDPNNTSDAYVVNRIGDKVLAQPTAISRGVDYISRTTTITINGNGFADFVPVGNIINLSNLASYPPLGAQLRFESLPNDVFTVANITPLGGFNSNLSATLRISPSIKEFDGLAHDEGVLINERYSQIRLTGHDFLEIGVGNFVEANYPDIDVLDKNQFNEVVEGNGGRVFYTSTDQDGNFRTGELFAVEQATGIVTISADFFNLDGLTELQLGGVRLGGTGVVIREFSTDATFTENSNNVVPTQRAIATFLQNRLSQGGTELATNSFIAGTIRCGPSQFDNTAGLATVFPSVVEFSGDCNISGAIVASAYFYGSFVSDR